MGRHSAPEEPDGTLPPLVPERPRQHESREVPAEWFVRTPTAPVPVPPPAPLRTERAVDPTGRGFSLPSLGAPSLDTGPVTLPPVSRRDRRGRLVGRVAIAVSGLAIAAGTAVAATSQRSDAAEGFFPGPFAPAATSTPTGTPTATASTTATASRPTPTVGTTGSGSSTASGPTPTPSTSETARPTGTPAPDPTVPTRTAHPTASPTSSPTGTDEPSPHPTRTRPAPTPTTEPSDPGDGTVHSLRAAVSGRATDLPAGLFRFDDFGSDLLGVDLTGRLTGAGAGSTTLSMSPGTSSKKARVPHRDWTTNQLSLIRISHATTIGGFTLRGTDQGHLYNGLRISKSSGAEISNLRVLSIPGDDDIPPGETFGINDFHTSGSRYRSVEVDGKGISGATFGTNSSSDVTITDSYFHDAGHSNGATFWQTKDVTVKDTVSTGNHDAAFNFERVSGQVLLDHVTMRDNKMDLRINSDKGSADYRIVDPVLSGGRLTIVMTPRYMGHANLQRKSDVELVIDGKDRSDLIRWVDHH